MLSRVLALGARLRLACLLVSYTASSHKVFEASVGVSRGDAADATRRR